MKKRDPAKPELNAQRQKWDEAYSEDPDFFGDAPSYPARKAADLMRAEGRKRILELGAGQGRDTIFFAKGGCHVCAVDYSQAAVEGVRQKAGALSLSKSVDAVCHDVREPLPFEDASFDACYCHMLYCMAFSTSELEALFKEVRRVLKPGGLSIYTVRHTGDAHYRKGTHRGEGMYETCGFIVHFFSREKVEQLAKGYEIMGIEEFEEGELPRKLFLIVMKKHILSKTNDR